MRNRVLAASLALLTVAVGCTAADSARSPRSGPSVSDRTPPAPRILAFSDYLRPRAGFYADLLMVIDPDTFEPEKSLRLGEAVSTRVADPAREFLALGGYNFGKVIVVDPVSLEVRARVTVTRRSGVSAPEVHAVAWPRPDRLLGYTQDFAAHNLLPGRAFVADPESNELVRSVPVRGSVMSATTTPLGVAFLVAPVRRVGRARVVFMDVDGDLRRVRLRRIEAGYVDPGTPGESLLRDPALVSVRDTVYVIGASEPVAAVDLRSGSVSYHRIPGLMEGEVPGSVDPATGSAGALARLRRDAVAVGGARILVSGDETEVVRGGGYLRSFDRPAQIVDVERWRVRRSFEGLSDVRLAGRTILGRDRGDRLVALRLDGEVLHRRRGRDRSWVVVGDRLLETSVNGRRVVELDLRSGRVVAELGNVGSWVSSAFAWPPRRTGVESVIL